MEEKCVEKLFILVFLFSKIAESEVYKNCFCYCFITRLEYVFIHTLRLVSSQQKGNRNVLRGAKNDVNVKVFVACNGILTIRFGQKTAERFGNFFEIPVENSP